MAFDTKKYGGYGTGALGDVANPTGQINSYANVTTYTANSITIGSPSTGVYETFVVGTEIIVHVSATNGTSTDTTYLGKYMTCKITAVAGSVLTVDNDFTVIMPVTEFAKYQVQAVTIAQFGSLTLSTGTVTPIAYNVSNKYGGIIAIKCKDTLTMSGGSINLVDKGIPVASVAYRPKTTQETQGTLDTDSYAGWENHITVRQMLMNAGDGIAFIMVKNFAQTGTTSRIGGTQPGVQFTRGNRVGGSTILLVADTISGFNPSIISTVKNSGSGLGRCYIASNTKLRNDEGLYAYDCVSDNMRLMKSLNIKDFGNGILGDVTNPMLPLNNYARVTAIGDNGKVISYVNKTTNGIAPIAKDSMIMFHVSKQVDNNDMGLLGKFILAKVISDDGNNLILDTAVTKIFDIANLSKYNCQIISVAQFNNLTISNNYTATTAWNAATATGGICAISCKGICNVENGKINVETKGGGTAYAREGLAFIGNAQDCDILPIGQGHGSVFLLTPQLTGNSASRIGATYDGANFNGTGGCSNNLSTRYAGGYTGIVNTAGSGGYNGGGSGTPHNNDYGGMAGSGAKAGIFGNDCGGGYGSNAPFISYGNSLQGAHLFIIASAITGIALTNISTGGGLGPSPAGGNGYGDNGGCGYGGGGGVGNDYYSGTGGSSSGWAFIYCNTIINENTTGVVV